MATDKELEKFRQICGSLSAHFKGYVVIVVGEESLMMKSSDPTWAIGACERFKDAMRNDDLMKEVNKLGEEEPE